MDFDFERMSRAGWIIFLVFIPLLIEITAVYVKRDLGAGLLRLIDAPGAFACNWLVGKILFLELSVYSGRPLSFFCWMLLCLIGIAWLIKHCLAFRLSGKSAAVSCLLGVIAGLCPDDAFWVLIIAAIILCIFPSRLLVLFCLFTLNVELFMARPPLLFGVSAVLSVFVLTVVSSTPWCRLAAELP